MGPAKLGETMVVLELLGEGGSYTVMCAEVLAWADPGRPAGHYEELSCNSEAEAPKRQWVRDGVFWLDTCSMPVDEDFDGESPAHPMKKEAPDQAALPANLHFHEDIQALFAASLDAGPWWMLYPRQVHPHWQAFLAAKLESCRPGWREDLGRYQMEWETRNDWLKFLWPHVETSAWDSPLAPDAWHLEYVIQVPLDAPMGVSIQGEGSLPKCRIRPIGSTSKVALWGTPAWSALPLDAAEALLRDLQSALVPLFPGGAGGGPPPGGSTAFLTFRTQDAPQRLLWVDRRPGSPCSLGPLASRLEDYARCWERHFPS